MVVGKLEWFCEHYVSEEKYNLWEAESSLTKEEREEILSDLRRRLDDLRRQRH